MSESPPKKLRLDEPVLPLDLSKPREKSPPVLPQGVPQIPKNISLISSNFLTDISTKILLLEYELTKCIEKINFNSPIEYIYSPIDYAYSVHYDYVNKYCKNRKKILFLGMNPGPWGMSQTGVPFGEVDVVKNWLKLSGNINKPIREQPDRLISGFSCKRSEVSGRRFWELFKRLSKTPDVFFQQSYLRNYCPVALMDAGGRNITPAELKGQEQSAVVGICDWFLGESIKLLGIERIVGIGRFAEKRAKNVVTNFGFSAGVAWLPHPSPRSTGTQDWSSKALQTLTDLSLINYLTNEEYFAPGVS